MDLTCEKRIPATGEMVRVGGRSKLGLFKFINVRTNQKPVCDFILVNNTLSNYRF